MIDPTGFQRRPMRDDYRQILITIENAVNQVEKYGAKTPEKIAAVVHLFRAMLQVERCLLDELDRQDPDVDEDLELDFETDLRLLLESSGEEEPSP